MTKLIDCQSLQFSYLLGKQKVAALRDISFSVSAGSFVCLSGPSGSGKSTLLNVLGLIEPLQDGEILLSGQPLSQLSERERNHIRRFDLGFIFQSFHLIDVLTAAENVEFFLARQGVVKAERKQRTEQALTSVGLWEQRDKRPPEMSGGQRQRVAIARALAKRPRVILADEPTASLDQQNGKEVVAILKKLAREQNVTAIVSSHDAMVVSEAEIVIRMQDGRIVGNEGVARAA